MQYIDFINKKLLIKYTFFFQMHLKLIDYIKYTLHLQHKTFTLLKTIIWDKIQFITNLPAPFPLKTDKQTQPKQKFSAHQENTNRKDLK